MFLLLLLLPLLFAQEKLPTINVLDSSQSFLKNVSTPVWQSSEQELLEKNQVQDVLQAAPGVVFTQNGGVGGRGAFYLRGSESRHSIFLTDGLRLNDPSNTDRHYDTAFLLMPFYQDLLFLRGPSPVLYGGDATSGVIELLPRRGRSANDTLLSIGVGSFDTEQGFILQDWRVGHHQGSLGMIHQKTNGFSRLNKKRHGAKEADGAINTQIQQASSHRWAKNWQTDFWIQGIKGSAEQDGSSIDEKDDRTDNQQGSLAQITRAQFSGGHWWLRTGIISHKRDLKTAAIGEETYNGENRQIQSGVQFLHKSWETLAGVQWDGEWIATETFHRQNDLGAIFLLERYRINQWLVELGARQEQHQRYNNFLAYESTLKYQSLNAWSVYAKGAKGYKTPSLYQLYAPPLFGSPLGNTELTPEKNISIEVGLLWSGQYQMELVAFQQDFQDLITYSNQGYQNRGNLRVQGLELSALTPESNWGQLRGSGSILGYSQTSQTPLRRPPYMMSMSWLKSWEKWSSDLSIRAIGGRKDMDVNGDNAYLVAYELVNASLKWQPNLRDQWTLTFGNLTNREYEDVWGYSVAPLNMQLQYLGRF